MSPPVLYINLGTDQKYPDYQGVLVFQISLHAKGYFGTITKCPDYADVLINRFHYNTQYQRFINFKIPYILHIKLFIKTTQCMGGVLSHSK